MKHTLLFFFIILTAAICTTEKGYAQFSIDNETKATSKKTEIEMVMPSIPPYRVETEAWLNELQRRKRYSNNYFETNNSLYFTQFGYVNWQSGGENTYNGRAQTQNKYIYRYKKVVFDSYFNAAYGLGVKEGEVNGEKRKTLWKTEDYFELNATINYKLYGKWSYSLGINLASQFSKGYSDVSKTNYVSTFFAPATFKPYFGISYTYDDKRKITIAPISGNLVFVLDDSLAFAGAYGVKPGMILENGDRIPGKRMKATVGGYVNIQWEQNITRDGMLKWKTNFQTFFDYRTVPNMSWENWIDLSVYKFFSVNFYAKLYFDDKIPRPLNGSFWQFRETLGFGIAYKFQNKEKPETVWKP